MQPESDRGIWEGVHWNMCLLAYGGFLFTLEEAAWENTNVRPTLLNKKVPRQSLHSICNTMKSNYNQAQCLPAQTDWRELCFSKNKDVIDFIPRLTSLETKQNSATLQSAGKKCHRMSIQTLSSPPWRPLSPHTEASKLLSFPGMSIIESLRDVNKNPTIYVEKHGSHFDMILSSLKFPHPLASRINCTDSVHSFIMHSTSIYWGSSHSSRYWGRCSIEQNRKIPLS